MTGRETPRWTPQSTTPLEPPPPPQLRLARGSVAPPVDDADDTAPHVRLIALFEHEPSVPVPLEPPPPVVTPPVRPRTRRGAPLGLSVAVIAVLAWLGYLMLTR